jgi:hypothetical protein
VEQTQVLFIPHTSPIPHVTPLHSETVVGVVGTVVCVVWLVGVGDIGEEEEEEDGAVAVVLEEGFMVDAEVDVDGKGGVVGSVVVGGGIEQLLLKKYRFVASNKADGWLVYVQHALSCAFQSNAAHELPS